MRSILVTKLQFIFLTLVFILASKSLTLGKAGAGENIAPTANGFCLTEDCEAGDSSLHPQIPDLWKPAPEIQADEITHHPDFGSNFKSNPAEERNTQPGRFSSVYEISGARKSISEKSSDEIESPSSQNDLFRNENRSLGRKFLRASALTQGIQAANLAVMLALPDDYVKYSCDSWSEAKRNLHRAWTNPPVWDTDPWRTNFLAHPYAGGLYYNAFRSQGASTRASFLFSVSQSLVWEYGFEAVTEQPSIQDLIFTPTLGSVLGEFFHRATVWMGRNGFSAIEKIVVSIINPIYVVNNGFKKLHREHPPIF